MSARALGIVYEFGGFTLDASRRLLLSGPGGHAIPLPTTSVDTLLYLVEHAGELVDKASLLQAIWPGVSVAENSLAQSISALRRALGDRRSDPRFIVTVPGRGYRFIATIAVHAVPRGEPSLAVLPFKPLGETDVPDALSLGMTDALIRRVGRLHHIDVKPLSTKGARARPGVRGGARTARANSRSLLSRLGWRRTRTSTCVGNQPAIVDAPPLRGIAAARERTDR